MTVAPSNANAAPAPAPAPYVFVVPEASAAQLETLRSLDPRVDWRQLGHGEYSWCLQTFLELRDRGWPVALLSEPQPGHVNFVHAAHLSSLKPTAEAFIVAIRADYPRVPWAAANVVQNRLQADDRGSFWIPHWPQPGLIPRAADRDTVQCVAYAGVPCWLARGERQWSAALKALGIEFRRLGHDNWNDYSTVDVLVAVRSFDESRYDEKPPSKLFNAWHARVPLIAGYDSAFEQIGRPGVDYFRVSTLEQAIAAIERLRDDRTLYRSVVDAGAARATVYSRDRIAECWQNLLSGPISLRYLRWQQRGYRYRIGHRMHVHAWWLNRQLRRIAKRSLQQATGRREPFWKAVTSTK
jgi:hypothetical protein